MLASLGIRSRVVTLESKFLLRLLKLSAGPNRLPNYPYGETATALNPFSLQFTTSASISNPLPNANILHEARRFIHVAETVRA